VRPPYPEILKPFADELVDTGTPVISGTSVPNGSVEVYLDGEKSGSTVVDAEGRWTFRPSSTLSNGSHRVSGKAMDEIGNISEEHSPERAFTVLISEGGTQVIGGGVSCSSSGSQPFLPLLGLGLLLSVRRRRRA
jgi:MYXO-CTERM domain-containing protein